MALILVNHWRRRNKTEKKRIQVKCGRWGGLDKPLRGTQHNRETCIRPSLCPCTRLSVCVFVWISWISGISNTESRKALPTTRTHRDRRKSRSVSQLCAYVLVCMCVRERERQRRFCTYITPWCIIISPILSLVERGGYKSVLVLFKFLSLE